MGVVYVRPGFEIGFDLCGCFALLKQGRVVHVAKSLNMCTRVENYRNRLRNYRAGKRWEEAGQSSIIYDFDQIRLYPCPREELDQLERELAGVYGISLSKRRPNARRDIVLNKKIDLAALAKAAGVDLKELGL